MKNVNIGYLIFHFMIRSFFCVDPNYFNLYYFLLLEELPFTFSYANMLVIFFPFSLYVDVFILKTSVLWDNFVRKIILV